MAGFWTPLPWRPDIITDRAELQDIARKLGVRADWHEPDEQGVTARVTGYQFDNAGPYGGPDIWVELWRKNPDRLISFDRRECGVNLATLFAIACAPCPDCGH